MPAAAPQTAATKSIPEGHRTVAPYLVLERADEFMAFAQRAFGAEVIMRHARADGALMHGEIRIGDSIIMVGGASEKFPPFPAMIHLYMDDVDAVYHSALQAGAQSIMEVADQFYGDRSGGVKDDWGNTWWIATHREDVSAEEFARRFAKACG